MTKVGYLLYNERPYDGLIRTQVISLLGEIKRQEGEIQLTLLSFIPPHSAIRNRAQISEVREELNSQGVDLLLAPFSVPYRLFLFNILLMPILFICALPPVLLLIRLREFEVLHCRSYFPAMLGWAAQRLLGMRVIFDMRSLFPEENITAGAWTERSLSFRAWKAMEKRLFREADCVVGVSSPFLAHIRGIEPNARVDIVPCCVDLGQFSFNAQARANLRRRLGLDSSLVVAYEGRLDKWNDARTYAAYFSFIKGTWGRGVHFLVITPTDERLFAAEFEARGIGSEIYTVIHAQPSEIGDLLSAADVGIQVMPPLPDSETRLGVKFVEYLACGLPVITNPNVGAAAAIVKHYGVGLVLDLDEPLASTRLAAFLDAQETFRSKCRSLARELFSTEACAASYIEIYRNLRKPSVVNGSLRG